MDVAIDFDPEQLVSLFTLAGLKETVETQLGCKVDPGLRRDLLPRVAEALEREAVRIF